jgi:hypothetical protein
MFYHCTKPKKNKKACFFWKHVRAFFAIFSSQACTNTVRTYDITEATRARLVYRNDAACFTWTFYNKRGQTLYVMDLPQTPTNLEQAARMLYTYLNFNNVFTEDRQGLYKYFHFINKHDTVPWA